MSDPIVVNFNQEIVNLKAAADALFAKTGGGATAASVAASNPAVIKFPPARTPADVTDADVQTLNATLTAYFAKQYPKVGSHITPGANAQKMVLSFYPAGIAQQRAAEKFEEAAALQGDDYQAFGRENPGQGDFVYQSLVSGQPLSDFYGN